MITRRHLLVGAGTLLLQAAHTLAHPPYELSAGKFQRTDGTVLFVVKHYVDGIMAADRVSIQFRLADGTELARTKHITHAALRRSPQHIDIYQFDGTFLPIATRVQRFDGYTLADITSPAAIRVSPLVHTEFLWRSYLLALAAAPLLLGAWYGIRHIPSRGWFAIVRAFSCIVVGFFGLIYFLVLLYGPISPVILAILGALPALAFVFIRNHFRQSTRA